MTLFGWHAAHEQHAPSTLLEHVRAAEAAGFQGAMSADHLHPWVPENGNSGFAWSWLGAALHATSFSIGVVNAPGDRYHPAIIAQAAATLAEMFPRRFWIAVGSGEALNEHVTGNPWPSKRERNERLRECVDVMRALWRGETVTHRGRVVVDEARIYSLPAEPPRLLGAAVTEVTAQWVAGWADGLITVGRPRADMQSMIDAFHRGGGEGKPILVQDAFSWAPKLEDARRAVHEWRFACIGGDRVWDIRTPEDFEAATRKYSIDDVAAQIPTSATLAEHAERLHTYAELGIDDVYCHNLWRDQRTFVETFGAEVLPQLR